MKQKKHSIGEIIRILRQADGDGTVESICREHNISKATFHRWRRRYGDIEKEDPVLDVFAGSGTTGVVALDLGLRFVGYEINDDFCRLSEQRLRSLNEVENTPK